MSDERDSGGEILLGAVYGAVALYLIQCMFRNGLSVTVARPEYATAQKSKKADHDLLASRTFADAKAVDGHKADAANNQQNGSVADKGAARYMPFGLFGFGRDEVAYRGGDFVYVRHGLLKDKKGFIEVKRGGVIVGFRNSLFNRIRFGVFGHGFTVVKSAQSTGVAI